MSSGVFGAEFAWICARYAAATLYYGPQVFAVEAASQGYLAWFGQHFTSNTNVGVALVIMWISLIVAVGVIGWLFLRAWGQ